MPLPQDWNAIAQERQRSWDAAVSQQQLLAQIPRQRRPQRRWRRWTGSGLVRIGSRLMHWGEQMAENECEPGVSMPG